MMMSSSLEYTFFSNAPTTVARPCLDETWFYLDDSMGLAKWKPSFRMLRMLRKLAPEAVTARVLPTNLRCMLGARPHEKSKDITD